MGTTAPIYDELVRRIEGPNGRQRRKLANNTYGRIEGHEAHVELHDTTVVTARKDGTVTYRDGGWRTATTKSRISDWLPAGLGIVQDDYEWYFWRRRTVDGEWKSVRELSYVSGITLDQTDGKLVGIEQSDGSILTGDSPRPAEREELRKQIRAYVRLYTDKELEHFAQAVTDGPGVLLSPEQIKRLVDNKAVSPTLVLNALAWAGVRHPRVWLSMGLEDGVRRHVRKFLMGLLIDGRPVTDELEKFLQHN